MVVGSHYNSHLLLHLHVETTYLAILNNIISTRYIAAGYLLYILGHSSAGTFSFFMLVTLHPLF